MGTRWMICPDTSPSPLNPDTLGLHECAFIVWSPYGIPGAGPFGSPYG
jgi:hypothetical protein